MKITESTQTAMQAMEVLLSGLQRPECLRVTHKGEVKIASSFTLLFGRLARALNLAKKVTDTLIDWRSKAYDAVFEKMRKEVVLVTGEISSKDSKNLDQFLQRTMSTAQDNPNFNWRDRLSDELSALNEDTETAALAGALKNVVILSKPENAALYPYVKKQLLVEEKFADALEQGLKIFLAKERGLSSSSAENAAKTMCHLMTTYDSSVMEAWFITSCAGQMVLNKTWTGQKETAIPLAYLRVHYGFTLGKAITVYTNLCQHGKSVIDEPHKLSTMQIYDVAFDEADAIVSLAESLEQTAPGKLSQAQWIEIAWLRLHKNMNPDEAALTSIETSCLSGSLPPQREAALTATQAKLNQEIDRAIAQALPIGWPDDWQSMPDGSRRLKKVNDFQIEFMNFLEGSMNDCVIDETQGLSDKFIQDVGRSKFKFNRGASGVTVSTDREKAITELAKFIPDVTARQTLSKALFQAGGNGLEFAMGLGLRQSGKAQFAILSLNITTDNRNTKSDYYMSLQHTDDGKVRVGYTLYMKHFTLMNTDTGDQFPVNSGYRDSVANEKDHTARAVAVIEFDYDELCKGILKAQWVRPPELSLTIEPDREALWTKMVKTRLRTITQRRG